MIDKNKNNDYLTIQYHIAGIENDKLLTNRLKIMLCGEDA